MYVYSKKTDSVEQHLLNMISILSLWFYLDLEVQKYMLFTSAL